MRALNCGMPAAVMAGDFSAKNEFADRGQKKLRAPAWDGSPCFTRSVASVVFTLARGIHPSVLPSQRQVGNDLQNLMSKPLPPHSPISQIVM